MNSAIISLKHQVKYCDENIERHVNTQARLEEQLEGSKKMQREEEQRKAEMLAAIAKLEGSE